MPWQKLYESCVSETNPNKLKKLVFQLEDAIVLRYHDLACEPNVPNGTNGLNGPNGGGGLTGSDELQALRRAAERLVQLKTEKLGWLHRASPAVAAMPASMPTSMPASMPIPMPIDDVKQDPTLPRIAWRGRIQSALVATQRAWQNWVFKSLK